jgi:hypothetical protein
MAYRIPFAVRQKNSDKMNGRYFLTLHDHRTGKPLKLEDFEPQVRAHLNVVTSQNNTCTVCMLI